VAGTKRRVRFTKISADGAVLKPNAKEWAVVHDAATNLFWSREAISVESQSAALKAAKSVKLAGLKGWRAPSRIELLSLVDDTRYSPAIDTTFFPECPSAWFWTSTPYAPSPDYAWIVYFYYGSSDANLRDSYGGFVRAVRPGQLSDLGPSPRASRKAKRGRRQ